MDYLYDSLGRLTGSGFAQTPYTGFTPSGSNPWYDSSHSAQSRARAFYAYDAGGRTLACEHYWDVLTSGTTTYGSPTTITWQYGDYAEVGTAENPKRTFQTMTKLSGGMGSSLTAEEMDYQYDSSGRLTGSGFAQTPYTGFTPSGSNPWYDSSHPAQSRARAFYAYDAGGRTLACEHYWEVLTSGTTTYGTPTTITQNDCTYDAVLGLKTASANYVPTMTPSTWTDSYTYDSQLDYLASATYGTSPTVSWTYDAAGNRTDSVCDNLNRTTSIGGVSTTCDILGNRTALGSSTTYGWDVLNRMTGLTNSTATSSYVYRADGMRIHKTVGYVNTEYYHDRQIPVEDAVINGTTLTTTRYGLGTRGIDYEEEGVGTWTNSTTRSPGSYSNVGFPIYDAHGNMIATLTRASGSSFTVNNQRTLDAWGSIRSGGSNGDPKNRFCANLGHQQDDESELICMQARYLDPSSGRFISEDPAMKDVDFFVYASNDPVNAVDPSGCGTTYTFGDWVIRLDRYLGGDWHASYKGQEVLSRFFNGTVKHSAKDAGERMLAQFVEDLNAVMKAGNSQALACGRNMQRSGVIGVDVNLGFAIVAITSIDAYAQANPSDFADLMMTLGGFGRN